MQSAPQGALPHLGVLEAHPVAGPSTTPVIVNGPKAVAGGSLQQDPQAILDDKVHDHFSMVNFRSGMVSKAGFT